jgi:hypothetical protein
MNTMIRNRIFIPCFFAVMLIICGCTGSKQVAASKIGLVKLDHYFTKNTVVFPGDVNYRVITRAEDFENIFGVAQTMDSKVIRPDFSSQTVVAILLPPTNKETFMHFEKAEIAGEEINIYYNITNRGKELSYTISPNALATIPRVADAKQVNFHTGGMKVKTLQMK